PRRPIPSPAAPRLAPGGAMFEEMDRLRESAPLQTLLAHYADLAAPDRQAWQDRRMDLEGVSARDLAGVHGELIAYGWLEQNTGAPETASATGPRACYRVTPAGVRALKAFRKGEAEAA